jgi:hypothetical protein
VLAKLHDRLLVRPTLVVDKIIVDGDMASVRFHSTGGKGKNGADFSTDYCWVFRLIDGAIAEIWGYYDTGKMIDLFGERPLSVGTAEGRCGASSFRPPSCDRSARLLHDAESAPGFRHVEEDLCGLSAFKDARV